MSYQLPDLLIFLTSILPDSVTNTEHDGDLHINPFYASLFPNTNDVFCKNEVLFHLFSNSPPQIKTTTPTTTKDKLKKTLKELLEEYNPGLLASLYLPFSSILNVRDEEEEEVMNVVWEWLSVCAIVVEETVRPDRIIRVTVASEKAWMKECLETTATRLRKFTYSPTILIQAILTASHHPPPKPQFQHHPTHTSTLITEYLNWRIQLSGHQVLTGLFIPPHLYPKYARAIELILEINVCVVDLFAYNIHQAWSSSNHLNLISYLLLCGGGESGMMTVQGAVNATGEMIRLRMVELKNELGNEEGKKESDGFLANIFSPFFSNNDRTETQDPDKSDFDIRKTLWNWVSGIIHWAYEVEYFAPDLDNDKKKKRGGEVRDYGWVFLIANQ